MTITYNNKSEVDIKIAAKTFEEALEIYYPKNKFEYGSLVEIKLDARAIAGDVKIKNFYNLAILDLRFNKIEKLEIDDDSINKLEIVDLWVNKLEEVDSWFLRLNEKLIKRVILKDNKLSKLSDNFVNKLNLMSNLTTLDLSNSDSNRFIFRNDVKTEIKRNSFNHDDNNYQKLLAYSEKSEIIKLDNTIKAFDSNESEGNIAKKLIDEAYLIDESRKLEEVPLDNENIKGISESNGISKLITNNKLNVFIIMLILISLMFLTLRRKVIFKVEKK